MRFFRVGLVLLLCLIGVLFLGATTVVFAATSASSGLVTDGEGRPLSGVEVVVRQRMADGRGGQRWEQITTATTGADGRYTLDNLPPGAYQVDVRSSTYLAQVGELVVHPDQAATASDAGQMSSIRGRVTDSEARGVKQIAVSLYRSFNDPFGNISWTLTQRVLTGGNGGYHLRAVPAGSYRLAFADALFPERYLAEYFDDVQEFELAATLSVAPGVPLRNGDARLAPAGLIAGRVTNEAGNALAAVTTILYRNLEYPEGDYWLQAGSNFTLEDGSYQYTGLPPGRYRIQFTDFTGSLGYLPEFYADATSLETATDIPLAAGDQLTEINASLAAPGSISGMVTDEAGNPLTNIGVYLYQETNGLWSPAPGGAFTDLSGVFVVGGLAPGVYRLGFADPFLPPRYRGEYYNEASTVEVATDIVLEKGGAITGIDAQLATQGRIRGLVTDEQGAPLTAIVVEAYLFVNDSFRGEGWSVYLSTSTGDDGRYELPGLVAGNYRLAFHDSFMPPRFQPEFYADAATVETAIDILVADGATVEGIDAILAATGSISGQVTDEKGNPLFEIGVTCHRQKQDADGNIYWTPDHLVFSDENGQYRCERLAPDPYRVSFVDPSGRYALEYYDNRSSLDSATDITVELGGVIGGIDAQLAQGGAIEGIVTDEIGAGIPSIYVRFYQWSDQGWQLFSPGAFTDAMGAYQIGGLPAGVYRLEFTETFAPPRYRSEFYNDVPTLEAATDVVVQAGLPSAGVNAQLASLGSVRGVVTGEERAPASNIRITAYYLEQTEDGVWFWTPYRDAYTDEQGGYQLTGLAPQTYRVGFTDMTNPQRYQREYYADALTIDEAADLPMAAGETRAGIDAQLAPAGHISGRVTDESGAPLPNITVTDLIRLPSVPTGESWDPQASVVTDASGMYELAGVAAGVHRIYFVDNTGQFVDEYYNNAAAFEHATNIDAGVSETVSGIDAQLALATPAGGSSDTALLMNHQVLLPLVSQ